MATELQIFLILNQPTLNVPRWNQQLSTLAQHYRIELTLVNNGMPVPLNRWLTSLKLPHRVETLMLHYSPAQVLSHLCQRKPNAPAILFLDSNALWDPARLEHWLTQLPNWTAIAPRWQLPSSLDNLDLRLRQEPVLLNRYLEGGDLSLSGLDNVPPCLCFSSERLAEIVRWCQPSGQLPILWLGVDEGSYTWCDTPTVNSTLTVREGEKRWKNGFQNPTELQRLLIESPSSPRIYQALAQQVLPDQALPLLKQALETQELIVPDLLALACQAFLALGQETEAIRMKNYLDSRFPGFRLPASPWVAQLATQPVVPLTLPPRKRLSVCMIVRNEEQWLPRALESVKAVADELIVVDTGSQDQTVEIATHYGARVFEQPWQDDFAAARNYALAQASGDWILSLDADEQLDPGSRPYLNQLLWNNPPGLTVFAARFLEHTSNNEVSLIHWNDRLFPNHPSLRFQGAIHETIVQALRTEPELVLLPWLTLHHYSYTNDETQRKAKFNHKRELLEQQIKQYPDSPRWLYYLGDTYYAYKYYQEAIPLLEKALQSWKNQGRSSHFLSPRAALALLHSWIELKDWATAKRFLPQAEAFCQEIPDYWYFRGQLYTALQQPELAIHAFETCLSFRSRLSGLTGFYTPLYAERFALVELTNLYWQQAFSQALDTAPRLRALGQLRRLLNQLLQLYPDGYSEPKEQNLFDMLGQVAVLSALYQPGSSPVEFFSESLPEGSAEQGVAFYVMTALMFLANQLERIPGRLPPGYSFEMVRDLRANPWYLSEFARQLWSQPELEGPALATSFLHCASIFHRDSSFELLLAQLHYEQSDPQQALRVLRDARVVFPQDPYVCNNLGMLLFQADLPQEAEQQLQEALRLNPDFTDAQENLTQLQQHLASVNANHLE